MKEVFTLRKNKKVRKNKRKICNECDKIIKIGEKAGYCESCFYDYHKNCLIDRRYCPRCSPFVDTKIVEKKNDN